MTDAEKTQDLPKLLAEIRACKACAADLPLGPRPIVRGEASARLLIISQAPGKRVHQTGLSFDDKSGERLRCWLGLESRHLLRRSPGRDCADRLLLSRKRQGRRPAAATRMRSAMARAPARSIAGHRIDPARRALCDRPLPPGAASLEDAPDDRMLAGFLAGVLRAAASELAYDALASRQSLVRQRGPARVARAGYCRYQSIAASMRSISSSLNPKWCPISWISTWRTTAPNLRQSRTNSRESDGGRERSCRDWAADR